MLIKSQPVASPISRTGVHIVPLLLPFLAVVAMSVFSSVSLPMGTTDRSHNTTLRENGLGTDNTPPLIRTDYSPVMFSSRFTLLWGNVLRSQYRGVSRCGNVLQNVHGAEKAKAQSNYLMCLRAYNELAALAPDEAFTGQAFPRHIPETPSRLQSAE